MHSDIDNNNTSKYCIYSTEMLESDFSACVFNGPDDSIYNLVSISIAHYRYHVLLDKAIKHLNKGMHRLTLYVVSMK